jgi:hypothetical protein
MDIGFKIEYYVWLYLAFVSSNSIRMGGDISSSYCPDFTLQINAAKKRAATLILAMSKMIITLM